MPSFWSPSGLSLHTRKPVLEKNSASHSATTMAPAMASFFLFMRFSLFRPFRQAFFDEGGGAFRALGAAHGLRKTLRGEVEQPVELDRADLEHDLLGHGVGVRRAAQHLFERLAEQAFPV